MLRAQNSPIKYLAASIDGVLPAVIDYEKPNLVGVEVGSELAALRARFVHQFLVAVRKLTGHIAKVQVFPPKHDIGAHAEKCENGQELVESGHGDIIANSIPAFLLATIPALFYMNCSMDAYTLVKVWLASMVLLAWAITAKISYSQVHVPIVLYLACLSFSSLFSYYWPLAVFGQMNYHACGIMPTILTICAFQAGHGAHRARLLRLFVLMGAILAVNCIGQQVGLWAPYHIDTWGRSYGLLGAPVYTAGLLGCTAVAAFAMGYRAAFLLMFMAILTTKSRCGVVGAAAGIAVILATKYKFKANLLCLLGAMVLSGAVYAQYAIPHQQSDRLRGCMIYTAYKSFMSSPVIGVGPEQFTIEFERYRKPEWDAYFGRSTSNAHSHNSVTESLMSTGVVGTIPFLLIFAFLVVILLREGQYTQLGILAAGAAYSMVQPMPIAMKISLAAVVGSGVPAWRTLSRPIHAAYVAVLAASAVAVCLMLYAARVAYVAVQAGDVPTMTRIFKYAPPMMPGYIIGSVNSIKDEVARLKK